MRDSLTVELSAAARRFGLGTLSLTRALQRGVRFHFRPHGSRTSLYRMKSRFPSAISEPCLHKRSYALPIVQIRQAGHAEFFVAHGKHYEHCDLARGAARVAEQLGVDEINELCVK